EAWERGVRRGTVVPLLSPSLPPQKWPICRQMTARDSDSRFGGRNGLVCLLLTVARSTATTGAWPSPTIRRLHRPGPARTLGSPSRRTMRPFRCQSALIRKDQGCGPGLQALDRGLLLKKAAERFLVDEGGASVPLDGARCVRHWPSASIIRRAAAAPEYCCCPVISRPSR